MQLQLGNSFVHPLQFHVQRTNNGTARRDGSLVCQWALGGRAGIPIDGGDCRQWSTLSHGTFELKEKVSDMGLPSGVGARWAAGEM